MNMYDKSKQVTCAVRNKAVAKLFRLVRLLFHLSYSTYSLVNQTQFLCRALSTYNLQSISALQRNRVWFTRLLYIENKCSKLLEYKSVSFKSSISVSFMIEFIVATALTGEASSLHTLCSCRLAE